MNRIGYFYYLIFCAVLFCTWGCKKDNNANQSTNSTNLNHSDGSMSTETNYYGNLSVKKVEFLMTNDSIQNDNEILGSASFSSSAYNVSGTPNSIRVDSVGLNNIRFKYDGFLYYNDTTYTMFSAPFSWNVKGANGIPSFNYTVYSPLPRIKTYSFIPDSIKVSQGITFNLDSITDANHAIIILNDNNSSNFLWREYIVTNGFLQVSLNQNETGAFSTGNNGTLIVWLLNDHKVYFNNKTFDFTTELGISNQVKFY